jgi:transcriptional regulator with XRE-family HTH domain
LLDATNYPTYILKGIQVEAKTMLNDNIRTIRKNKGFTQEDLANRLHVTRQTISKWEKGLSVPDAEMLSRLADELEVPVSELLGAGNIPAEQSDVLVACNMYILGTSEAEGLPGGYNGTTKWIYIFDDQEYKYEIWYDDNYECGTISIDENAGADLEKELLASKDANDFAAVLEKYYEDKGGELIHEETKGLDLKE